MRTPQFMTHALLVKYAMRISWIAATVLILPACTGAQEGSADEPAARHEVIAEGMPDTSKMRQLMEEHEVWLDKEQKRVVVGGEIALNQGPLELFACTRHTKEHESVVTVNSPAYVIHAALLGVGAETGTAVQFLPEFRPASGMEVDVMAYWQDRDSQVHHVKAQDWVRHIQTGKALEQPWVFAGSGFWTDPMTGDKHYLAEEGDFICVSNFPSAMLDLPIASSQQAGQLLFEAFSPRIPPRGTKVLLVLTPRLEQKAKEEAPAEEAGGSDTDES